MSNTWAARIIGKAKKYKMNHLQELFKRKDKGLLNIYFTAGFPHLEDTGKIILGLDKAGVDLIEIGMPYSDPLADGPTIQKSGSKALENGMHLELLFTQVKKCTKPNQSTFNPHGLFQSGDAIWCGKIYAKMPGLPD